MPQTNHFGFQLASAGEVRAARARFQSKGVPESEWSDSRPTRVQVLDPDGYRVELYAYYDGRVRISCRHRWSDASFHPLRTRERT